MMALTAGAAQARPARFLRWQIVAGVAALAGGSAMVAGAFLPWVETFAGLIAIPGVRGGYGRVLAGDGALIAGAGLYYLIRGGRWPRWVVGLAGFAAAGFSGYLLIQLAATMRALSGDSMVLARGGPGLWVIVAGALAAFATLFLPASSAPAVSEPVIPAQDPRAVPRPAYGWQARVVRLRHVVVSRTADQESSGTRRRLQIALGMVWLADAALQFQPFMFTRAFATQMLAPAATGNPAVLAAPALWATRLIGQDTPAWNSLFALAQLAFALGLLWRPTVKVALAASIAWALGVWWIGEGLGGVLTGTASPVTGAPGAVLLYALLAVLAWPSRSSRAGHDAIAAAGFASTWAKAAWAALWISFAYLILQPAVRAPHALASALTANADGEPGWLAAIDRWAATAAGGHGLAVSVALAVVFALIAAGVLIPAATRPALSLAVVVALAIWVIGENFGLIFTGMGTDPNSGPLLALLAAACWPPGTATPAAPLREGSAARTSAVL